jgi:hypothetical protein
MLYNYTYRLYVSSNTFNYEQVHLVNKVSRLLQPSVIYIDGGEKPFLKKVPKTDKTDPKRLKKDLPKIVKSISQDDQVGHENHAVYIFLLALVNIKYQIYVLYMLGRYYCDN